MGNFFDDGGFGLELFGGKEIKAPPTIAQNLQSAINDVSKNRGQLNTLQTLDFENAISQFKKLQPQVSEEELNLLRRFEPQFQQFALNSFENSLTGLGQIEGKLDPVGVEIRNLLKSQILEELKNPTAIDPHLAREVEQGIRGAQSARGTSIGNSAVTSEAIGRGSLAEQLRRTRQTVGQNILKTNQQLGLSNLAGGFTSNPRFSGNVTDFENQNSASNLFPTVFAQQTGQNALENNIEQFNSTRMLRALKGAAGVLGSAIGVGGGGGGISKLFSAGTTGGLGA